MNIAAKYRMQKCMKKSGPLMKRIVLLSFALLMFNQEWLFAQVISNNGAAISISSGAVVVTGDVDNTSGTVTNDGTVTTNNIANTSTLQGDGTYNIAQSFTNSGTFSIGTSTVNYNGAAQTVLNSNYYNLTLSGSGAKTLQTGTTSIGGNFSMSGSAAATAVVGLTIGGNVTLDGSTSFTSGSFVHNVGGNWTNNGGTFTPGSGTVTFTGNTSAINGTAATQTFNNIVINKTAGQTLSVGGSTTTLNVNDLTETQGDFTPPATLTIAGTFTHLAGTLTAGTNINIGGDWTRNGGTFTQGGGTVTFNGSSAQSINGSAATTFNNLTLNNAAGLTNATTTTTVNSILTLTSGAYTLTSALTIGNGATIIRRDGSLSAAPTFGTTVDLQYTNTGTISTGPEIPTIATVLNNLTVNNSAPVTLSDNAQVNGDLIINSGTLNLSSFTADRTVAGGTLNLGAGATLRIGGANGFPANYITRTLDATSTVEYYGSTQTISNETYGNLTLSGSGPKATPTGTTTTTVAGNFTLGSGITYERNTAGGTTSNLTLNGTTNTNDGIVGSSSNPFNTLTVGDGAGDNLTNNGTITTETALSGTGSLTQGTNAILKIGGTSGITTLDATANGNTVMYIGTAAQTIKATTYYDLTIANSGATATTAAATTVNNSFTVSSGTAALAGFNFTVNGATSVTGALNVTGAAGTKTFNNFTINVGGVFNNSSNSNITINGNIQNDGTVTSGTGVYTLAGTGKTISGASSTTITNITVTGSYTNNGTLTVSTALAGTGTFTNGTNATLNFQGATLDVTTFDASSFVNTVSYNSNTNQTIRTGAYHHVSLSSNAQRNKIAANDITVNGDFTIGGSSRFSAGGAGTTYTHTFYGNWIVNTDNTNGAFLPRLSTVIFETPGSPAATSIDGTFTGTIDFNNLTITNTSGVSENLNISVAATLTVNAGATLTPAEDIAIDGGGTGTLTGSGTVKVTRIAATADFINQYTNITRTLTNLTVDYDASGAQTVNALNYNNLTIRQARDGNNVTLEAGTIGIAGIFSPLASFSTGGYIITGSTIDFNGAGAQTIPAFNYNNLTISNARTTNNITLASSGTIGVAAAFSNTATFTTGGYVNSGSTINFNGSGAQTVAAFDYNNLTLSNAGVKTFAATTSRIAGNLTISGATADATTNTPTIELNGTSQQTIPAFTCTNFTMNNASGALLTGNLTVEGTLTFTNGTITTGANKVSLLNGATSSGASSTSFVIGNFEKYIALGTTTIDFEVGSIGRYTPVNITSASVSSAGTLTVTTTQSDHPEILTSAIEASQSVNRYWTLTSGGAAFSTYEATFNFIAGDIDGGADWNTFAADLYTGGAWTPASESVTGRTSTSTTVSGLSSLGGFQIGEPVSAVLKTWDGGASTNDWEDANNWNPDGVPTTSNNVSLTGANTISINSSAECNSITLNNNGLTLTIQSGSLAASGGFSLVSGTLNVQTNAFPTVTGTTSITGGTVQYSGNSQTVKALTYNHLTLSGSGTKTFESGSTTYIESDFTSSGVIVTTTNTTINFSGSGAQSVAAINYNNLTFSNSGVKTYASGTTGIAGIFSIEGAASADATTNSGTINYNGSGAQNVQPINYYHLILSNSGTKTFSNAATTGIAGDFSVSGATADATTNSTTINFNGSVLQAVAAINYYNLTLSNSSTKRFVTGTLGIANILSITGSASADATTNSTTVNYNGGSQNIAQIDYHHLTLSISGTKTFASGTTQIAGNFTISGTAVPGVTGSTIEYNGASSQSTPAMSYENLTINNASGISLSGNADVSGTLTFTSGNITTSSYSLTLTSTATTSGAGTSSHVVGNLKKWYRASAGAGDPVTQTYEIGDATAYTPVSVTITRVNAPNYLTASTTTGDHAQILTSGVDNTKSVNRYWTLTNNGIGFTAAGYSAIFNFINPDDIDAGAATGSFIVRRYSGGSWNATTIGTRTAASTQITGEDFFGDFQIGEAGSVAYTWDGGAGTSYWDDADNWSPSNAVPTSIDNVSLTGANTIIIRTAAQCNAISLNNSSLTVTIQSSSSLTVTGTLTLTNGTLNTEEAFPTAGTYNITGGTVGYTASGNQNVQGSIDYNNLAISGSGAKTALSSIIVNGDITLSGTATLDDGGFQIDDGDGAGTLSLASGTTLSLGSATTATNFPIDFATITLNAASTVVYNSDQTQTISIVPTYGNLTLASTAAVVKDFSGTLNVSGSLNVNANNTFSVPGGSTVNITGDLNLNGTLSNDGTINIGP